MPRAAPTPGIAAPPDSPAMRCDSSGRVVAGRPAVEPVAGAARRGSTRGRARHSAAQQVLARRALRGLAAAISVAAVSGALLYCYPATLGPARGLLVVLHNLSGDAAVLCSGIYLALHLPRVWGLRRRWASRCSGLAAVGLWGASALTGFYGQFAPLPPAAGAWHVHVWSSLLAVVVAGAHGICAGRGVAAPCGSGIGPRSEG